MSQWLPDEIHSKLASEYNFVAKRMAEEKSPLAKLYFFSAMFNEISRLLNWHWDEDLALLHVVMQATHTQLNTRMGQPSIVNLDMGRILAVLTETAQSLATYVGKNSKDRNELCGILARIAALNYASTNHGTYIAEKGLLKL